MDRGKREVHVTYWPDVDGDGNKCRIWCKRGPTSFTRTIASNHIRLTSIEGEELEAVYIRGPYEAAPTCLRVWRLAQLGVRPDKIVSAAGDVDGYGAKDFDTRHFAPMPMPEDASLSIRALSQHIETVHTADSASAFCAALEQICLEAELLISKERAGPAKYAYVDETALRYVRVGLRQAFANPALPIPWLEGTYELGYLFMALADKLPELSMRVQVKHNVKESLDVGVIYNIKLLRQLGMPPYVEEAFKRISTEYMRECSTLLQDAMNVFGMKEELHDDYPSVLP